MMEASPTPPNSGDLKPSASNRHSHVDRRDMPERITSTDSVSASHGTRASHVGVRRGHPAVHSPRVGVLDIRRPHSICGPASALANYAVYALFFHLTVQMQPELYTDLRGESWVTEHVTPSRNQ